MWSDALPSPYGKPGDRLWVRETFAIGQSAAYDEIPMYRADWEYPDSAMVTWKPSIFMPRWASRITLEITNVGVERVRDITPEGSVTEGIEPVGQGWRDYLGNGVICGTDKCVLPRDSFHSLWDSINKKRGFGWSVNPWVWVIAFRRIR
jgi:hypothetical protein